MIKKLTIGQTEYFQNRFKKKLLPDIDAAGPISASILAEMANPLKFMTSGEKPQTSDMAYGTLVDLLWITPDIWDEHCIVKPADGPKQLTPAQLGSIEKGTARQATLDSKYWWDKFNEKALGKMIVPIEILNQVRMARNVLELHPLSSHLWDVSEKQVVLSGESDKLHPSGKMIQAKGMLDLLPQHGSMIVDGVEIDLTRTVVDLKQCHNCSNYGMTKAIMTFQYHMKLSWYLNLLQASGETQRDTAILIFQNSKDPYDVHVRVLSPKDLERGRAQYIHRIDLMQRISSENIPALFDNEASTIELPEWSKEE